MQYVITIILFLAVLFVVKVSFPLRRFYILSANIIDTYEMIDVIIQKAKANEIHDLYTQKIVLKYGKYRISFDNLQQAYQSLAKQCEKALRYADQIAKLPIDPKEYSREREKVVSIYNFVRTELWKRDALK